MEIEKYSKELSDLIKERDSLKQENKIISDFFKLVICSSPNGKLSFEAFPQEELDKLSISFGSQIGLTIRKEWGFKELTKEDLNLLKQR